MGAACPTTSVRSSAAPNIHRTRLFLMCVFFGQCPHRVGLDVLLSTTVYRTHTHTHTCQLSISTCQLPVSASLPFLAPPSSARPFVRKWALFVTASSRGVADLPGDHRLGSLELAGRPETRRRLRLRLTRVREARWDGTVEMGQRHGPMEIAEVD